MSELTLEQEMFCKYYVSEETFAHGTHAYAKAYKVDLERAGAYNSAKVSASRLLTNDNILNRINELLDLEGLNDSFVDKQLLFTIKQNADLGAKVSAMKEYNKLKQRIENKLKIEGQVIEVKITGKDDC